MHKAILWGTMDRREKENVVRCRLCAHYCIIEDGDTGECLVRENRSGELFTKSYGMAVGTAMDPVEKKPFYHFKPQSMALSFGTPGCNFTCQNCQNWDLSHGFRLHKIARYDRGLSPEEIVRTAVAKGADGIAYTYSEPTIFFEYARDTILHAKKEYPDAGLYHVFISNGFFSNELMDMIEKEKLIDAVNIDLKFMEEEKYRRICDGGVKPVLNAIKRINELRGEIHLEIINLVIPGENDSADDLKRLCGFIASVSPDIPLHFSRFYPQFKMSGYEATPLEKLSEAYEIAKEAGLQYVFVGNADIPATQDTICPDCGTALIRRSRYGILKNLFEGCRDNACPNCGHKINIVL